MRPPVHLVLGILFTAVICCMDQSVFAASFHSGVLRPATSPASRSSASRLTARANADANNAAGNPYVNPNVAAGRHGTQQRASANADAAEIQSAHVDVGPN